MSKKAYSVAVINNFKYKGRSLSKLLVNGFDEEQIWQQIDLLNNAAASSISRTIRSINSKDISLNALKSHNQTLLHVNEDSKVSHENITETANDDLLSEDSSVEEEYAFDDDSDSLDDIENRTKRKPVTQKHLGYKSEVDDQFFRLSKLEEFLRIEDIKEEKGDNIPSDDEIDFFQDIPSDENEDFEEDSDEEEEKTKKVCVIFNIVLSNRFSYY